MDSPNESEVARNAAFQRVGRNVANFQILEHSLKALLPSLRLTGTLSEIELRRREQARTLKKASLGKLTSQLYGTLFSSSEEQVDHEALTEPAVTFNLRVDAAPEFVTSYKKRWLALVEERNRLVHTELLNYNLKSVDDCQKLSVYLDEQNSRIREHFAEIKQLRDAHSAMSTELLAFLQSQEFTRLMGISENDG